LRGFATPHFAAAGLCFAKPFCAAAKRQLPGTLNDIFELFLHLREKFYAANAMLLMIDNET